MSEGQHRARVVVAADGKSAERGFSVLRRENTQLHQDVDRLSAALAKAEQRNEKLIGSTGKLARAQHEAARAAQREGDAVKAGAIAKAAKTADQARRAREKIESSGTATAAQRVAAIRTEVQARIHQASVEMKSAKTVADAHRIESRMQQITHEGYLARMRVEREEAQHTAEVQVRAAKRAQRAQADALAAHQRSQSALAAQRRAVNAPTLGTASAVAGGAGLALGGVAALGAAASQVSDLADESLRLQGVFKSLPWSISAARTSTKGLADDVTLATLAVKAQQTGVANSAQEFANIAGKAQLLAMKVGRDVPETITRLIEGVGKQERELFDELGLIIPHQDQINKALAESLGKTTKELTTQERAGGFLAEVMKSLDAATEGVEFSMDTAAAAVARTTVKVKNLRAAALGGVEAQRSLADGVKDLDVKTLKLVADFGAHRNSFYQVSAALDDAGVSTVEYANNSKKLQADIEKLLKSEAQRLGQLAERKKLTEDDAARAEELLQIDGLFGAASEKMLRRDLERLGAIKAQGQAAVAAAAESKLAKEEELKGIEDQIAFSKGSQVQAAQMNLLLAEEARLRAELLDLEGETTKAADLRRKAELAALEASGELLAPKKGRGRGGGKSRKDAAREIAQAEAEAKIAANVRVRDEMQRSLARENASYEELRIAVLQVQAAERMRAQLEIDQAKGKAENLRAETAMLDLRAQQGAELADLAEAEAQAERDRTAALWAGVQATNARAKTELEHAHELQAAAPNRAAGPGRQTLAQGLGIDAGPMSQSSAQTEMDMRAERERAAELRTLRQQQLDEERAYYSTQLEDEATRSAAKVELRRLDDEQSQLYFEADLERLQARQWAEDEAFAREQERLATRRQMLGDLTSFTLAQGESAVRSAISIAKTERAARRSAMDAARKDGKSKAEIEAAGAAAAKAARGNALIALGEEMQGQGIAYVFKAIAAGISLNPVGAATNAAAAAVMFGGAAAVKARGRSLVSSAGGAADAAAAPSADVGAAPAAGGGASGNPIPPSQRPGSNAAPPSAGNPAGASSSTSTSSAPNGASSRTITVNINAPIIDDKTIREIVDRIDDLQSEAA